MQLEAGVALRPSSDLRCLMRDVAVEDEVSLRVVGHLLLDAPEEPLELRRPVRALRADHPAGGHVQGGAEAGGGVAHVVMAASLRGAGNIPQGRLRPPER